MEGRNGITELYSSREEDNQCNAVIRENSERDGNTTQQPEVHANRAVTWTDLSKVYYILWSECRMPSPLLTSVFLYNRECMYSQ